MNGLRSDNVRRVLLFTLIVAIALLWLTVRSALPQIGCGAAGNFDVLDRGARPDVRATV